MTDGIFNTNERRILKEWAGGHDELVSKLEDSTNAMFFTDNWKIVGYNISPLVTKNGIGWYGSIIFERKTDKVVRHDSN